MKNGRRTKSLIAMLLCICLIAVLTGCSTLDSFRHAFIEKNNDDAENVNVTPTITIGVMEAMTGSNSEKGKDIIKGIELANSIYSNVKGYNVVISKVDTQSKVTTAETAIQGLIDMKPVAIIGASGEASSLAASDNIQEAQIPAITPSATNPLITQTNDYYFRGCLTESQMGEGLAEYAYVRQSSRHIGIISLKNDSSTAALLDGFKDRIKTYSKNVNNVIVSKTEIGASTEEMSQALDDAKKAGVDVCFVSLGNEAMDEFFTLAEDKGMTDVVFLGMRNWGRSEFVNLMKKHSDIKVVFPYVSVLSGSIQASNAQTEEAERFQIEYASKYGSEDIPSEYAALGYDSYLLVINAIDNATSIEGPDVRDAFRNIKDLKGVTGTFSFDDKGNVVRTVTLSTIDVKEWTVVPEYVTRNETEAKSLEDIETKQEAEEN